MIIRLGCKVFRFAYNPGNGTRRIGTGSDDLGTDVKSVPPFRVRVTGLQP